MLGIFTNILEVIENIPAYILYAAESFINLLFAAVEAALIALVALLPGLPEVVAPPELVGEINWFFPVGAVLGVMAPLLSAYIVFIGIRWAFNKFGAM